MTQRRLNLLAPDITFLAPAGMEVSMCLNSVESTLPVLRCIASTSTSYCTESGGISSKQSPLRNFLEHNIISIVKFLFWAVWERKEHVSNDCISQHVETSSNDDIFNKLLRIFSNWKTFNMFNTNFIQADNRVQHFQFSLICTPEWNYQINLAIHCVAFDVLTHVILVASNVTCDMQLEIHILVGDFQSTFSVALKETSDVPTHMR